MRGFRFLLIVSLAMLIAVSCKKRPEGVLSDKEMVGLIADMEVAEIYLQSRVHGYYNDSTKDKVLQYVLDCHGLDKASFDSTMVWYGRNIDDYRNLLSKVDEELQKRAGKIEGKDVETLVKSDLWPYSRHYIFSSLSETDNLQFSVPGTELVPGDRVEWELRLSALMQGQAMMGVEYETGPKAYTYASTGGNKKLNLNLQTDTARKISRIFGQIKLNNLTQQPVFMDSVSLKSLPYDSMEYYKINSQRLYRGPIRVMPKSEKRDSVEESGVSSSLDSDDNMTPRGKRIHNKDLPEPQNTSGSRKNLRTMQGVKDAKPIKMDQKLAPIK